MAVAFISVPMLSTVPVGRLTSAVCFGRQCSTAGDRSLATVSPRGTSMSDAPLLTPVLGFSLSPLTAAAAAAAAAAAEWALQP